MGAPDAERLALLVDASQQLADAGPQPTAVLERLCQLVMPRLCSACQVRLLSPDGHWLEPAASAHTDAWSPERMQRLASELSEHPHLLPPRPGSAHLLLLPLRARQHPLGTLAVYREPEEPPFDGAERLLLQALADRAGLALELAHAHEAERQARHAAEVAAERLQRLQRVSVALGEALTPAEVVRVVVEEMLSALGADRALAVLPLADEPEQLEVVSHRGLAPETLPHSRRIPITAPVPVAVAYRTGEPVWLESREALAHAFPESLVMRPEVTRAAAVLPLRTRGRTLGAIAFGFDSPRTFGADERGLLLDLARQSAQALERACLYEAAQQARTRAERVAARTARLQTLNAALSQVLTAPRVAEVVIDQGVAAIGAQVAGLWLVDEAGARLRLLRSVGLPPDITGPVSTLPLGYGSPLDDALRRGQPVLLESYEELVQRYPQVEQRVRTLATSALPLAVACLPLQVDGHGQGVLVLGFPGVHRFDDDERVFLTLLAHYAAQALERARLCAQERSAREALHEAHHTLQAIIQSSPTAITLLELDGTVRLWNPAAERIFGWKAQEVLGRFIPVVPEDKQREVLRDNLARVARGESILGQEMRRYRRDGTPIDVSLWATALQGAGGQPLCLAVVADMTERKRAEEALRDAIRLREEFLSIASHELRTPITAIQLHVQELLRALARGPEGLAPERLRRGLEVTARQVKRQMHLVNDLLDVSRLGAGRLVLRPEPMDLAVLVREVAERFELELARTGSRLTLHAPALVPGHWDRLRLEQVVTNLLSNAVKYGQGNPIELRVEAGDDGRVRLAVSDAGIGIAPEHLERVFGRFERAVSERHYGGFGLGLWIAREIIETMGGHISVSSQLGVGSTFRVELPRAPG